MAKKTKSRTKKPPQHRKGRRNTAAKTPRKKKVLAGTKKPRSTKKAPQRSERARRNQADLLQKSRQATLLKLQKAAEQARKKAEQYAEHIREQQEKEAERARVKAEQGAERARQQQERNAERARQKAAQEAERARKQQEKEAQRARQKAEQDAERVRKQQEKEAERSRRKAEQAAARAREQQEKVAERAREKAEQEAQRVRQKQEKAAEQARKKAAKDAERVRQQQEKDAERAKKAERKIESQKPSAGGLKPRYYLTTAIAYPNGAPHVGFAYELIATDAIARFKRLDGYDVHFLTGTDEHGIKMLQTASKEGLTPRQLLDRTVPRFRELLVRLNCSNDDYIRTTEERHYRSSQAIWERMQANGDIYLSKYSGWYSVRDEAYYDENETRIGDGGVRLGPQGTPVEWVEEESFFFRLSAYQDKLIDLYTRVPDFVLPKERLNEVASFVRGGLQDLSISRTTFDWGIPVPAQSGSNSKHIMYVWVDALTNYITAVGFPDTESAQFRRYWPADLHVIGKDIVRFHAVYWPAFLMSAGIEVPRRIFCHGHILSRGEKISKSVGNVIDPFALIDAYGVDQLRYFLLREVQFGQDGNYSHETIVNRINAELANDLGNLAQRSLSMIGKQLGGTLPTPGEFSANDRAILAGADAMIGKAREAMKAQQLNQVLNAVWEVVADANRYFAGEAPWALAKTDPAKQGTVLYVTAEVIRQVAILAQPFIPASAAKLLDLLAIPPDERSFAVLGGGHRIAPGTALPAPTGVFPRYVEPDPNEAGQGAKGA